MPAPIATQPILRGTLHLDQQISLDEQDQFDIIAPQALSLVRIPKGTTARIVGFDIEQAYTLNVPGGASINHSDLHLVPKGSLKVQVVCEIQYTWDDGRTLYPAVSPKMLDKGTQEKVAALLAKHPVPSRIDLNPTIQ